MEKLKKGLHYISIKNNELNVYKREEKKRYKVEVTNCPDLEEILVNKQKFNVEFKNSQKNYLGITKEMLILTDKTNYQIITILQEEKEENKNESED